MGPLDDFSIWQASLGVSEGGLGVRRCTDAALPAFVASRGESRWILTELAERSPSGLLPAGLVSSYDADTDTTVQLMRRNLSTVHAEQATALLDAAVSSRSTTTAALAGRTRRQRESTLTGDSLILPAGSEDREFDTSGLQADLQRLFDSDNSARLRDHLAASGHEDRCRHLWELCHSSTSHAWLWRVSKAHGPVVPTAEFQDALRLRVGAPLAKPGTACIRCGFALSATTGTHCWLCALPEATK